MTLILSNDDVERLLPMQLCIAALEEGYRDLAAGEAVTRPRSDCLVPTKRPDAVYGLKTMDGVVPRAGVAAVRINSDIITWPTEKGTHRRVKIPAAPDSRYVGLVLLFSTENGEPLAIFPDGVMQRLRVGATNGLAAKYMAQADAQTVGLLGSGWQAGTQLTAVCEVRNITRIRCFSPNRERREAFAKEMTPQLNVEVEPVATPEEAVRGASIVMCATNAIEPVFFEQWLEPGMHLSSLKRPEIAPEAIARADRVVIHAGVATPLHEFGRNLDVVPERYRTDAEARSFRDWPLLQSVVAGEVSGRKSTSEITCFINNLGLGFQFAAAGAVLYQKAREAGAGRELPTEWFTEDVHP